MSTEQLDEAGLFRLAEFFDAEERPDDCLMLDELDGFLTALACTPGHVGEEEWLAEIWGGGEPGFASAAEQEEILGLIRAFYRLIEDRLQDTEAFDPFWYIEEDEAGNEIIEPEGWCLGFMLAVDMHSEYWDEQFSSGEEMLWLAPITAFAIYQLPESADDPTLAELASNPVLREEFIKAIPFAVQDIYSLRNTRH